MAQVAVANVTATGGAEGGAVAYQAHRTIALVATDSLCSQPVGFFGTVADAQRAVERSFGAIAFRWVRSDLAGVESWVGYVEL